jgi:hypothetical protein
MLQSDSCGCAQSTDNEVHLCEWEKEARCTSWIEVPDRKRRFETLSIDSMIILNCILKGYLRFLQHWSWTCNVPVCIWVGRYKTNVSILRGQYPLLACFQSHFFSHLYVCLSLPTQLNFQPHGWRKQVVPEYLHLSAKGYHIPED